MGIGLGKARFLPTLMVVPSLVACGLLSSNVPKAHQPTVVGVVADSIPAGATADVTLADGKPIHMGPGAFRAGSFRKGDLLVGWTDDAGLPAFVSFSPNDPEHPGDRWAIGYDDFVAWDRGDWILLKYGVELRKAAAFRPDRTLRPDGNEWAYWAESPAGFLLNDNAEIVEWP